MCISGCERLLLYIYLFPLKFKWSKIHLQLFFNCMFITILFNNKSLFEKLPLRMNRLPPSKAVGIFSDFPSGESSMRSWTCQSDSTSSTRVRLVAPRVSQTAEERPSHPQPTTASVASHPSRHWVPECFTMCVWDYATTTAPWCQLQYNKAHITRSQQNDSLRSTSDVCVYINSARKLRSMCQVNMSAARVSECCCVQSGQS